MALHLGTFDNDPETRVHNVRPLRTDPFGHPYIPGSTIAGSLRAHCRNVPTLADKQARDCGAAVLDAIDNRGQCGALTTDARTLIRRFHRFEDMILRFAVDLTVPSRTTSPKERSDQSRSNNAPPAAPDAP